MSLMKGQASLRICMNKILGELLNQRKFLIAVFFGLAVFLLYGHNLDSFWHSDDPVILLHALSYPLVDIFIDPAAWQALHQVNLTPWVSLSFFVDYSFAGFSPEFFYWHHLAALMLTGVASYLLLSLFVSRTWALLGSLLFLLGTPVAALAAQLMTRHYVEGLLFSLLSLYFFFRCQRSQAKIWLLASVLCFAIAVTAKETYVPLGLLFLLLAGPGLRERVWQSLPFVAVLLVYVIWRTYMLPGLVEGYVANTEYFTLGFWVEVIASLLAMPKLILGVYVVPVLVLLALLFIGTIRKFGRQWLLFLFCAGLVCGPLIPLVNFPGIVTPDRFVLLPWYLFCFVAAFFTGKLLESSAGGSAKPSLIKYGTAVFLWALACMAVPRARMDYLNNINHHFQVVDAQLRFLWNRNEAVAFIPTAEVAGALYMLPAMKALKLIENPHAAIPTPVVDDKFLTAGQQMFAYSAACNCMVDITGEIPARLQRLHANEQPDRPLSLDISNADGLISWNFGPYDTGTYTVVIEGMGSAVLPRTQKNFRVHMREDIDFYLRYDAPEGWITYSSLIHLAPDGMVVRWERN
jgi:hypothetical protein